MLHRSNPPHKSIKCDFSRRWRCRRPRHPTPRPPARGRNTRNTNLTTICFCRCQLRFPSTNIRLSFQSLVDENSEPPPKVREVSPVRMRDRSGGGAAPGGMGPLRINIPDASDVYVSPFPSPTGTISAANSCPASPRGSPRRQSRCVDSLPLFVGGHGRRNVSADLQMVAAYAAQVARRDAGGGSHHDQNHSPDHYRQPTSNGNSVG